MFDHQDDVFLLTSRTVEAEKFPRRNQQKRVPFLSAEAINYSRVRGVVRIGISQSVSSRRSGQKRTTNHPPQQSIADIIDNCN